MWGIRLFGRGKEDVDESTCVECGRTLLAGEWTQRLVDDDGNETLICSLCSRPGPVDQETVSADTTPAGTGRVRMSRTESDSFWRALKDKDAQIERLESLLARSEAEKQELAAELAHLKGAPLDEAAAGGRAAPEDTLPGKPPAPPTEETAAPPVPPAPTSPAISSDSSAATRTDPRLGESLRAASTPDDPAVVAPPPPEIAPAPAAPDARLDEPTEPDPGASLTILQRGVDLLNVSAVPKRIVETNENLGIPHIHVGSEDDSTLLIGKQSGIYYPIGNSSH